MRSSSTASGETCKVRPANQLSHLGRKGKFTPELRILVASLLSMVVIIGYAKYFGPRPSVETLRKNQVARAAPDIPSPPMPAAAVTEPIISAATMISSPTADTQERTIVVENALYRVEFSNRGAVVKSWQLKNYNDNSKPQKMLNLVRQRAAKQTGGWPFSVAMDDPQLEQAANVGLYRVSSSSFSLQAPVDLTFTWSDGHLEISKTFHFDQSYVVSVKTDTRIDGAHVLAGLAWRGGFGDATASDSESSASVMAFYSENGRLSTLLEKKLDGPEKWDNVWQGGKTFTGIEDRYFTATFLPPDDSRSTPLQTRYWKVWDTVNEDGKDKSEAIPEIATATSGQPMTMRVFVGPKDYDTLKAINPHLNSLVQFGSLKLIADPLFHALKWIHRYIPNWGWAIIVLTLVINMVLFPLRVSSYRKQLKMQSVAPEIKQIQEKYKKYKLNDPHKAEMNKEVMAVYSREGINPLGGCIPMLLQMPIWIGLNSALRGTIELRHASWIWIHDLASKDPSYILPVMVGISMYLGYKMTPIATPASDPQQAQMVKLMPLSMAVMFVVFPLSSGLALYVLTQGLIGIWQQWYLNRTHPLPAPINPGTPRNE
jgi:YidC/Oxa1 family membrane protein insertase